MFFQSIAGGFATLIHWQVWVVFFVYVLARFGWLMFVGGVMGRGDSGVRQGAGCLTHVIGGSVFQAIILGLLVLVLTPIMLGGDTFLPFSFFKLLAWPIFKACMISMVAVIVLSFLPIIGKLISSTPGVDDFIQGIIIFRFFSAAFIETQLSQANLPIDIYPGFWESVGFLVIALVLTLVCMFAFAALGIKISENRYSGDESVSFFLTAAIIPLVSLIPLFMYAKHVSLAIERMVK